MNRKRNKNISVSFKPAEVKPTDKVNYWWKWYPRTGIIDTQTEKIGRIKTIVNILIPKDILLLIQ